MKNSLFDTNQCRSIALGTGLVALDVVINSDVHQPPRLWAGGTCGNVLTILSYLGWQAYPVSRLNEDTAAGYLMRDLSQWESISSLYIQVQGQYAHCCPADPP